MKNIIGVRFKKTGKLSFFDALDNELKIADHVLVNSERGEELARVVKILNENEIEDKEYEKIIRKATEKDISTIRENEKKAKEALEFCKKEAKKLGLTMKILMAEYTFDMSKLIIYFVSEERVDFRDLVKTIASKYRARIELRQIGPRDETKLYPCLGMCGREICCRTYIQDFDPVTIKMAKEQGLQINMSKLSGACGKLMCCLKYEEEAYKENLKSLPKVGEIVEVKESKETGKVVGVDILALKVKVRFGEGKEDERYEVYLADELKWKPKKKNNIQEASVTEENKD
ncbi:MAG: regulatory iron-sulfur-containing complex subunit RicT [Clostridia bacterium]|nr:regulatory iron-sulfur-containing complex subunit RicT [Clostridia bacterium]